MILYDTCLTGPSRMTWNSCIFKCNLICSLFKIILKGKPTWNCSSYFFETILDMYARLNQAFKITHFDYHFPVQFSNENSKYALSVYGIGDSHFPSCRAWNIGGIYLQFSGKQWSFTFQVCTCNVLFFCFRSVAYLKSAKVP